MNKEKTNSAEKTLSEKRRLIKRYLDMYKVREWIINGVMCKINEQDKEFISELKCSWSGLRPRTPDMQKVIDVYNKKLAELAGEELSRRKIKNE